MNFIRHENILINESTFLLSIIGMRSPVFNRPIKPRLNLKDLLVREFLLIKSTGYF